MRKEIGRARREEGEQEGRKENGERRRRGAGGEDRRGGRRTEGEDREEGKEGEEGRKENGRERGEGGETRGKENRKGEGREEGKEMIKSEIRCLKALLHSLYSDPGVFLSHTVSLLIQSPLGNDASCYLSVLGMRKCSQIPLSSSSSQLVGTFG